MATTKKKTTDKDQSVPVRGDDKPGAKSASSSPVATLRDVERLFEDFLERRWRNPFGGEWPKWAEAARLLPQTPAVDIVDREKEVVVRAQLPGFKKSDLDVAIADRTLTITGETREEKKEEKDNYFHQEIRTGNFSRSVLLPADVDAGTSQATYQDGVLELTLPKRRIAKQQQVPVR
jgi:HSP20 family protein